jgi:hypothetical protein
MLRRYGLRDDQFAQYERKTASYLTHHGHRKLPRGFVN